MALCCSGVPLIHCVVNTYSVVKNDDKITPNFVSENSSSFDYSIGRNRVPNLHFNRWKVADA